MARVAHGDVHGARGRAPRRRTCGAGRAAAARAGRGEGAATASSRSSSSPASAWPRSPPTRPTRSRNWCVSRCSGLQRDARGGPPRAGPGAPRHAGRSRARAALPREPGRREARVDAAEAVRQAAEAHLQSDPGPEEVTARATLGRHAELPGIPPPLDRRPRRLLGRAGEARSTGTSRSRRCSTIRGRRSRRWFVGGETNLCHNAVDRHLASRGDQKALVWISTEVNQQREFTYRQLHEEVNRVAAMMQSLGVKKGDRVIIYMPMIPEAVFAILACARIGAIHSVVFGGFAAASLAARIDDARPALMITADGGSRMGKVVLYKSLVDESLKLAKHPPKKVLLFQPRPRPERCRSWEQGRRLESFAKKHFQRRKFPAPGSNRTSRPTSSTPRAPPASRKACSATSVATRWRWRRR